MSKHPFLIGLAIALVLPVAAQEAAPDVQSPLGAVQRPAPPPPPARRFDAMPAALLQGLDKVTARTSTFEARVGQPVTFGQLTIIVKSCQKASPIDPPESAAFLDITESRADGAAAPVFQGWMFASSPALSAMEHPVYDIWVKDCRKSDSKARSSSKQ